MDEYVTDVDECDQKPYEERDKETSPESKVGEANSAISCKGPTKLVMSRV